MSEMGSRAGLCPGAREGLGGIGLALGVLWQDYCP